MRLSINMKGTTPLMFHNIQLADPLNKFTKEIKRYTSQKKKTDDIHEKIAYLEFLGGLYWDEMGPYVDASWLKKVAQAGGQLSKEGKNILRATSIVGAKISLQYTDAEGRPGARDSESLWNDPFYRDRRMVSLGPGRKTIRTRPIFNNWSLDYEVDLNEEGLTKNQYIDALVSAGRQIGLGEARTLGYGRFEVEVTEATEAKTK